jgi:MAF protein
LLGIAHEVLTVPIDESPRNGETPEGMACRLSQKKAHAVAERVGALPAWILAADTVVVHDGVMLGKPADAAQAVEFLTRLRDAHHEVVSGVTLLHAQTFNQRTETVTTTVHMRAYTIEEIRAYVDSGDAMDKAGAYAIQHRGFHPATSIDGCYANVMGFPLCVVRRMLNEAAGVGLPSAAESCELNLGILCTALAGTPGVYVRALRLAPGEAG